MRKMATVNIIIVGIRGGSRDAGGGGVADGDWHGDGSRYNDEDGDYSACGDALD